MRMVLRMQRAYLRGVAVLCIVWFAAELYLGSVAPKVWFTGALATIGSMMSHE